MFKNVVYKKIEKKIEIIVMSQMLRSIFNRHVQIIVYRSNVLSSISHTKNETENWTKNYFYVSLNFYNSDLQRNTIEKKVKAKSNKLLKITLTRTIQPIKFENKTTKIFFFLNKNHKSI